MVWLSGWAKRKSHVINAAAGAGTLYQVSIKVYKTTGTDGTEVLDGETIGKVYVGSNCRDDFGDIRFTDDDGDTLLDYYMERLSSATYAVFWVEVADSLETDPQTIYVYYGKADATTTSNMANTFLYSNGWEDQVVAWTKVYGAGDDAVSAASKYLFLDKGSTNYSNQYKRAFSISRLKLRIDLKSPNGVTGRDVAFMCTNQVGLASTYVAIAESAANIFEYYSGGVYHTIFTGITAQWYHIILKKIDVTPDTYDIYVYDESWTLKGSALGVAFYNVATTIEDVRAQTYVASQDGQFDNFYVCKYVDTEPAHSTWGAEESLPSLKVGMSIIPLGEMIFG